MKRKNSIFFTLLLVTMSIIPFQHAKAPIKKKVLPQKIIKKALPEVRGYIKLASDKKKVPEFRIYFNGMETTNNSEGFFSFPLQQGKPKELSLIISKKISPEFEKTNTIKNLNVKENKRHQAYSLKQTSEGNYGSLSWEETSIKDVNLSISPDSIVILVDPKYIDHLEKWNIPLATNDVQLPKIILKSDVTGKLERAAQKSLLYSLDSKIFHEKIHKRTQNMKDGKGTISHSW